MRVYAAQRAGLASNSVRALNRLGLAASLLLAGTLGLPGAGAVGLGDTRTLSLHHVHTGESLTITYKKNGQYDEDALKKLNWILRDWRKNEATRMDPKELDLLWEVYQEVGAKAPIEIICGYRSPATNEMLRNRSRRSGVAKFSQHTLGKAIDFYIPGVPLDVLRATAMRLQGGGVGYYPTSGSPFVHLDVGNVRAWPRMTREQLVKLFPDGRTVHLPADGKPLPGYQLALADLERKHRTAEAPRKRNFFAALFGRDKDAEETADAATARETSAPARSAKPTPAARVVLASAGGADNALPQPAPAAVPVPLPPRRPLYQIASAGGLPAPQPGTPAEQDASAINAIILARGLWDGISPPPTADARRQDAKLLEAKLQDMAPEASAAQRKPGGGAPAETAAVIRASDQDRVPPELALAYAAQADIPHAFAAPLGRLNAGASTSVTNKGSGSIASKPVTTLAANRIRPAGDRLDDPWLRGMVLTSSVQRALVVTRVGEPDFTTYTEFMQKPAVAVLMTFSGNPHLGMSAERFSGSAVVFPATVTFGPSSRRTATLER